MPTIYRHGGYRFFFFSNEGFPLEPAHVHVRKGSSTAKFWLEPEVRLDQAYELSASDLSELEHIIKERLNVFKEAWYAYFSGHSSS